METIPTSGTSESTTETLMGLDRTGEQSLCITITADGRENLGLRLLLRQILPVLNAPERYSPCERRALRQTIQAAIGETWKLDEEADGDG